MKREKNKNRVSTDDDSPPIIAAVADDDVHSHNIDMAEQLPSGDNGPNNYLSDNDVYEGDVDDREAEHATHMRAVVVTTAHDSELHANAQERAQHQTLSTVEVESEKLEVIEIRSDGSTGHLTPGRR